MIYLDNAATSFHKPDCVETAEEEAVEKRWKLHILSLIQDAGSQRCLRQKDRNVWHLQPMQQKH